MEIKCDLKIKNIDELQVLIKQATEIIDKIKNFKFDFEIIQCEHS